MSTRLLSFIVAALTASIALADVPQPKPATAAPVTPPVVQPAPQGSAVPLTAADAAAFLDGMLPTSMANRRHRGRDSRDRQGRRAAAQPRLRICGCREARARFRGGHAVPTCVHLEAVHLDRGHAAGRSRQARSRSRHQRIPGFQDRRLRRPADQAAPPHDAHRRLRRVAARLARRECQRREAARRRAEGQHPGAHLSAGHRARLLELRRIARGLHRRARVRHAVRAVHRGAHLQAAEDGALDLPADDAGRVARASLEQLCRSVGQACAVRVRLRTRPPARCRRPHRTWRSS